MGKYRTLSEAVDVLADTMNKQQVNANARIEKLEATVILDLDYLRNQNKAAQKINDPLQDLPTPNEIRLRLSRSLSEADVLRRLLRVAERRSQLLGHVDGQTAGLKCSRANSRENIPCE